VLKVLEKKRSAKPRELAEALQLEPIDIREALRALEQAGTVTITGFTNSRMVHLGRPDAATVATTAPKPMAKAEARPTSVPAPGARPIAEDIVVIEARDFAIRKRLNESPATLAQILQAMPLEADLTDAQRGEACRRALRRLVIKKVIYDVGDTWRLV
jgi:hypothetical protein